MADSNPSRLTPYSFLDVFANDGTIDASELAMLERLALEDQQVDDRERDVLSNIFGRVDPTRVTPALWKEIETFKARFGIV